ncbi:hypothetical protein B0H17DRAFT_1066827 [Mycena rosella]|uniref:F-box domain-containing protein n=1 Tax=Mycena rosella TaxID=1033263 RepID=A0AAD7DDR0_MYCRO|nr:hypothetical protein B0H17DRAFT_1066827 [Mycena rosella]
MSSSTQGKQAAILLLPTEILLEITSYHHSTPLPYERYRRATGDELLLGRFDVLRALSQTCRTFRWIFHALVWERLEALPSPLDRPGRHISLFKRRMTGILKTPSLPRCVRTLLVSLDLAAPNWNLFTVFVRFLQATPNLSALHITDISDRHAGILCDRLHAHTFPAVRTLAIPSALARIVSAFPNIRTLICAESFVPDAGARALLKAARKSCPALEGLVHFTPSPHVIICILAHFPCVKTLKFRHLVKLDELALLSPLQHLRSIEFPYRHTPRGDTLERICDAARALFLPADGAPIVVYQSVPEADIGDLLVKAGFAECPI